MAVLLKMDSPAVVILHLLMLYTSQDDVRPPKLADVEVAEMAALNWYPHLVGQPAVKVVPLLSGFWFPFPKAIKDSVAHLLSCPHRLVCQQSKGFPWAGLMRSNIGPTPLTEIAIATSILPAIDTGIRAISDRPSADITTGRIGVYHGLSPSSPTPRTSDLAP